jgi:hypothetical protein
MLVLADCHNEHFWFAPEVEWPPLPQLSLSVFSQPSFYVRRALAAEATTGAGETEPLNVVDTFSAF